MSGVKFFINGDGSGALAAIHGVEKGVHGLSHEINSGIRDTIVGAFAIDAIKDATEATIEFAESISKSSERIGITTDNIQALRLAARDAGKDLGFMEKVLLNLEKSAGANGSQKARKAFANLGISPEDLAHLDKVSLLQKTMQGTQGMSRGEAIANLSNIFGSKAANPLMAMQGKLGNFDQFKADEKNKGAIASNEDIEALAELKERWVEITDTVKTSAIPVLSWLLDAILNFGHGIKQLVELVATAVGAIFGSITKFDIGGLIQSFGENLINGFKSLFDNLWGVITGKISASDAIGNLGKTYADAIDNSLKQGLGVNVDDVKKQLNDKLLEQSEEDKKIEAEREKKRQERAEHQKDFNKDPNRGTPKSNKKEKNQLERSLGGNNEFLKIGEMTGVDKSYSIARLQTETNNLLDKVVENTGQIVDAINNLDLDSGDDGLQTGV